MKKQRARWTYLPAYFVLYGMFSFFRLLPLDTASALGGLIARSFGRFLKWNRVAKKNLEYIFPEWDDAKRRQVLRGMWDNLGRTMAEYFWLSTPEMASRIHLDNASKALLESKIQSGKPFICAGGHFANWEIIPPTGAMHGKKMMLIYRRANNPYVEKLIHQIRSTYADGHFPKGKKGAAEAIRALKSGRALAMLIDQKMNDGMQVSFMGKPAMAAPAVAELALKYHAPIVMMRVKRENGVHFRVSLQEIPLPDAAQENAVETIMLQLHAVMEQWLKDEPSQWLWVHQRWIKW